MAFVPSHFACEQDVWPEVKYTRNEAGVQGVVRDAGLFVSENVAVDDVTEFPWEVEELEGGAAEVEAALELG